MFFEVFKMYKRFLINIYKYKKKDKRLRKKNYINQ